MERAGMKGNTAGVCHATVGLVLSVWGAADAASRVSTAPTSPTATRPSLMPEGLSKDLTIWPNRVSWRNSDAWIWQNHDRIRKMRPRVLVLNFANDVDMDGIRSRTEKLFKALAEATRYHGFKDPAAPAFLEYEAVRYVDMRDDPIPPERKHRNSSLFPRKADGGKDFACDYSIFYGDSFARRYGFRDPEKAGRYLNLHELIHAGFVHELWFYAVHIYEEGWPAYEVIELKQFYDRHCRPIPGRHGPAGNGFDDSFPWSGRTFRMAFFNPHRGIGCAMENFGHGLEAYANSDAIAYYTPYFREFAEFDLDKRYGVPFKSLYELPYDAKESDWVTYPTKTSMKVRYRGREYTLKPYVAAGGNNHFAPGARHHYDLGSPYTVMSTIENWRMRNGPDGRDLALEFNKEKFLRYSEVAPDCQGAWMIFWRQCMPGLDNQCLDDDGNLMKNWWPFLFY